MLSMFYRQGNPGVTSVKNLQKRKRQKSARYWHLPCCKEGCEVALYCIFRVCTVLEKAGYDLPMTITLIYLLLWEHKNKSILFFLGRVSSSVWTSSLYNPFVIYDIWFRSQKSVC
jgi:hypothetical protein